MFTPDAGEPVLQHGEAGVHGGIPKAEFVRRLDSIEPAILVAQWDRQADLPSFQSRYRPNAESGCEDVLARYYSLDEIRFVLNNVINEQYPNRREHPRILAGVPGSVEVGGKIVSGTVANISEGGAFLKSFSGLKAGEEVKFTFDLGEGEEGRILCKSRVVYLKPYSIGLSLDIPGMGIAFVDIDPKEAEIIRHFVDERLIKKKK